MYSAILREGITKESVTHCRMNNSAKNKYTCVKSKWEKKKNRLKCRLIKNKNRPDVQYDLVRFTKKILLAQKL